MRDEDLCFLTATEALSRFKAKTLSPVELMEAILARSAQTNAKINAFTYEFPERALEQAKAAERRYARNAHVRPLEGIPLAVKDFHAVHGEVTTCGSRIFEGARPEYTVPTVQRLLDAGAILHARTTTPEFAHCGHCHSPLWGATRNPWNTAYSPGGSSGGAAAAVANGMTVLADGTDAGGSVRIPASASGVFGYKPPFGRNPLDADHPMEMMVSYGTLTRSVADGIRMQNVTAGHHPDDVTSLPKMTVPERPDDVRGWKIAFSPDLGYFEVDPEVRHNTDEALKVFRDLGCHVEEIALGWDMEVLDAWTIYFEALVATALSEFLPDWEDEMDPFLVATVKRGLEHDACRVLATYGVRGRMWQALAPIFQEYQVLLCPTLALPSVAAEHDNADPEFRIGGKRVPAMLQWALTYPFNLLNHLPAASVPTGFAANGVPTGLQIVGSSFEDASVFAAAAAYEAARPWTTSRPSL